MQTPFMHYLLPELKKVRMENREAKVRGRLLACGSQGACVCTDSTPSAAQFVLSSLFDTSYPCRSLAGPQHPPCLSPEPPVTRPCVLGCPDGSRRIGRLPAVHFPSIKTWESRPGLRSV